MYSESWCAERWKTLMAPVTGDVRDDLVREAAEYLGLTREQVLEKLDRAAEHFSDEWRATVSDPHDERALARFYNQSEHELFDLLEWHAADAIHYRTLICLDMIGDEPGRTLLDYGSGIGSDAIAFAHAGHDVTLADVSERLLRFARWRCEQRGYRVKSVDLKSEALPARAYDVAVCFDVLEHIPRPLRTLSAIRRALKPGGLLFLHAPFGVDAQRPMHVVHTDQVSPRMRMVGFNWRGDLESRFPSWLWAPRVYQRFELTPLDRFGYYLYDVLMPGPIGARLATAYRLMIPKGERVSG